MQGNVKKFVFFEKSTLKMGLRSYVAMLQKTSFFSLKTFFSQGLRKYSIHRMTVLDISKRCAWHSLLRYKKNQERTTRQTDYRAGNVKKFVFLLWKLSWEAMELSFKKNHFRLKTFFSQALRKFCIHRMTMFNIYKRCAQHSALRQ